MGEEEKEEEEEEETAKLFHWTQRIGGGQMEQRFQFVMTWIDIRNGFAWQERRRRNTRETGTNFNLISGIRFDAVDETEHSSSTITQLF